jgi:predicted PurR-regulated permease PerM
MNRLLTRLDPLVRTLLVVWLVVGIIILLWVMLELIVAIGTILGVFFVALVLGLILRPVAQFMAHTFRFSWALAVVALYLGLLSMIALVGWLVLPIAIAQAVAFAQQLDWAVINLPVIVASAQGWLNRQGISFDLATLLPAAVLSIQARATAEGLTGAVFAGAAATFGLVGSAVLAVLLSFFFVLNGDQMMAAFLALVPPLQQSSVQFVFTRVNQILGGYVRGYLLIMLLYGVGTGLIMAIAGLPDATLWGLLAGLVMIVPIVGGLVAMVPPLVLAIASGSTLAVVLTVVLLVVLQGVTFYGVEPRVLGQAVGMVPLWFFFVLLVGANLAGVLGAIFGIPIAAIIYALVLAVYEQRVLHRPRIVNADSSPHLDNQG